MTRIQKNIISEMPPPPPDSTIISDIFAPGEPNQLTADNWKERHNARVIAKAKSFTKQTKS